VYVFKLNWTFANLVYDAVTYSQLRVTSILEIHLKENLITDEGLKYITMFNNLKILYLRNHTKITKKSISYFNKMKSFRKFKYY
jgi:hypothetical protein